MNMPLKSRAIKLAACVGLFSVALAACDINPFGNKLHFKEQVQLSGGDIVEIDRVFKIEPFGEIGGPGGWTPEFNSFVVTRPAALSRLPAWRSDTGLVPIVFDIDPARHEWFVLATFFSCDAWYGLGRPKLPYAEFRLRDGRWQQIAFSPQWIGRPANVFTDISAKEGAVTHTLASKRERNSDPRIAPEYLKIVGQWRTGC